MAIRMRWRRILLWMGAILLGAAGPLMAYGPLVPWSPIHPGYTELRLGRARILYPSERTLPEAYRHVDEWVADGETFHQLQAKSRITIVLCRSWRDFHRFVLWQGGAPAGLTLATGDAIYITPKVDEKHFEHGEFVRHELSHAILAQNAPVLRTHEASRRDPWFVEGLAVWFGRQHAFVTQQEFFDRAASMGVAKTLKAGYGGTDLRYGYIAWRDYLDYLDQTYGHERFVAFMHAANEHPADKYAILQSTFGVSWNESVSRFEAAVLSRSFSPRE
jgi:hypothetical protein